MNDPAALPFPEWKSRLKDEFYRQASMTRSEAEQYVDGCGDDCWKEMWADEFSPSDAVAEEMSCWGD
jgi:hypothetical protein